MITFEILKEAITFGSINLVTQLLDLNPELMYESKVGTGYLLTYAVANNKGTVIDLFVERMKDPRVIYYEWGMIPVDFKELFLIKLLDENRTGPDDVISDANMTVFEYSISIAKDSLITRCIEKEPKYTIKFDDPISCARYYQLPLAMYMNVAKFCESEDSYPQIGDRILVKINNVMTEVIVDKLF